MTVILAALLPFGIVGGIATLARGLAFTVAACVAILGSVLVLYGALSFAASLAVSTRLGGVVAILAFVLVIGLPTYLLAVHEAAADDAPADGEDSETEDRPESQNDDASVFETEDRPESQGDDAPVSETEDRPESQGDETRRSGGREGPESGGCVSTPDNGTDGDDSAGTPGR